MIAVQLVSIKHPLEDLGITKCKLSPFWCVCAILMPGLVVLVFLFQLLFILCL